MMLPWRASLLWLLAACLGVSLAAQVTPEGVRQIPVGRLGFGALVLNSH